MCYVKLVAVRVDLNRQRQSLYGVAIVERNGHHAHRIMRLPSWLLKLTPGTEREVALTVQAIPANDTRIAWGQMVASLREVPGLRPARVSPCNGEQSGT